MALTVLDAGIIIGVLDSGDAHHEAAGVALRTVRGAGHDIVVPASAYAEVLVGPMTVGKKAVAIVDAFLDELPARVVALDAPMAREAARLRSRHKPGLRLPDSLVIATAEVLQAELILTTDAGWPTRSRMRIAPEVRVVGPSR